MNNSVGKSPEENKAELLAYLKQYLENEPGYQALVDFLEHKSDFFTAPAATEGPLARPGGLAAQALHAYTRFLHNIGVEDERRIAMKKPALGSEQTQKLMRSGSICCLLGDICLANHFESYEEKVGDTSTQKYRVKPDPFGDKDVIKPGSMSVSMLKILLPLSRSEAFAIRFHNSTLDHPNVHSAFQKNYLAYEVFRAYMDAFYLDANEG